jgi:hypothetical protein
VENQVQKFIVESISDLIQPSANSIAGKPHRNFKLKLVGSESKKELTFEEIMAGADVNIVNLDNTFTYTAWEGNSDYEALTKKVLNPLTNEEVFIALIDKADGTRALNFVGQSVKLDVAPYEFEGATRTTKNVVVFGQLSQEQAVEIARKREEKLNPSSLIVTQPQSQEIKADLF